MIPHVDFPKVYDPYQLCRAFKKDRSSRFGSRLTFVPVPAVFQHANPKGNKLLHRMSTWEPRFHSGLFSWSGIVLKSPTRIEPGPGRLVYPPPGTRQNDRSKPQKSNKLLQNAVTINWELGSPNASEKLLSYSCTFDFRTNFCDSETRSLWKYYILSHAIFCDFEFIVTNPRGRRIEPVATKNISKHP